MKKWMVVGVIGLGIGWWAAQMTAGVAIAATMSEAEAYDILVNGPTPEQRRQLAENCPPETPLMCCIALGGTLPACLLPGVGQ